ncbi:hypothetical protein TH61_15710 [Rufibacter sp. DG15C]|uniref:hypothetical protein n=1 Tax=Rufibacter sp. DG15C TaxID=1379909 RepID=UPI00078D9D7D|nr:hypothetical protein [Rufibacter sp. DG15C]AMM52345.1 hypothetical protein TH61_15710 [Rufibacter sp. DG15C]
MQKKELKKANGDVYFEAERLPDNSYILINWIGTQTLESVVMGGNHVLAMLREKPCIAVINSNQELVGPWDVAVNYLANKWAPAAHALGLKYFAHIISPGIFGQRSFEQFEKSVLVPLTVKQFEGKPEAERWLSEQESINTL